MSGFKAVLLSIWLAATAAIGVGSLTNSWKAGMVRHDSANIGPSGYRDCSAHGHCKEGWTLELYRSYKDLSVAGTASFALGVLSVLISTFILLVLLARPRWNGQGAGIVAILMSGVLLSPAIIFLVAISREPDLSQLSIGYSVYFFFGGTTCLMILGLLFAYGLAGPSERADLIRCPFCAEKIKAQAVLCRFCGSKFDAEASSSQSSQPATVMGSSRASAGPAVLAVAVLVADGLIIGGFLYKGESSTQDHAKGVSQHKPPPAAAPRKVAASRESMTALHETKDTRPIAKAASPRRSPVTVKIKLKIEPIEARASIRYKGKKYKGNAYSFNLYRSSRSEFVELSAPGYKSAQFSFVPNRSQTLLIKLKRKPSRSRSERVPRMRQPPRTGSSRARPSMGWHNPFDPN
ncbi:zinc ribbon domain-containing protein [Myxococcota bacterium]